MVYKILASFTPNFGVSPFESKSDHITSYKAILLAFVLDGFLSALNFVANVPNIFATYAFGI